MITIMEQMAEIRAVQETKKFIQYAEKSEQHQETEIYAQMTAMLADQFYHQTGDNITINRKEFAEMLTKQTMHGIELGKTI